MENTLEVKTKRLQFGSGNEVWGWFKTTDGERTDFRIDNDGAVEHTGKEIHPFILGLYEMLFNND